MYSWLTQSSYFVLRKAYVSVCYRIPPISKRLLLWQSEKLALVSSNFWEMIATAYFVTQAIIIIHGSFRYKYMGMLRSLVKVS